MIGAISPAAIQAVASHAVGVTEPETTTKRCTKCGEVKALTEFHRNSKEKHGVAYWCRPCRNAYLRERYANPAIAEAQRAYERQRDPRHRMLNSARSRAKKAGLPFSITIDDIVIPERCPAIGIRLKSGAGSGMLLPSSPTIDRIIPAMGYVKGNVDVISHRANAIKRDATLVESLQVALYMARCAEEKGNPKQ